MLCASGYVLLPEQARRFVYWFDGLKSPLKVYCCFFAEIHCYD